MKNIIAETILKEQPDLAALVNRDDLEELLADWLMRLRSHEQHEKRFSE